MDRFFFRHSSFSAFLFLLSYLPLFAGPTSAEQQRHSQLFGHFFIYLHFFFGYNFLLAARSIEQSLNRRGNVATFRSGAFLFNTLIQGGPFNSDKNEHQKADKAADIICISWTIGHQMIRLLGSYFAKRRMRTDEALLFAKRRAAFLLLKMSCAPSIRTVRQYSSWASLDDQRSL